MKVVSGDALNIWALINRWPDNYPGFWRPEDQILIFNLTYEHANLISLTVFYALFLFGGLWIKKYKSEFFMTALTVIGVYTLGTRVHERWNIPALPFLAKEASKTKSMVPVYSFFTVSNFINLFRVLYNNLYPSFIFSATTEGFIIIYSCLIGNIIIFFWLMGKYLDLI